MPSQSKTIQSLNDSLRPKSKGDKYNLKFETPKSVSTTSNLQHIDVVYKSITIPPVKIGKIEVWIEGNELIIPGDTACSNDLAATFYNESRNDNCVS